ncbi:MAG: hypothetical protein WCW13_05190 [archaeon]
MGQRPLVLNPTRRRKDFRELTRGLPKNRVNEFRDSVEVLLDTKRRVIYKSTQDHEFAKHFAKHLERMDLKFVELVPIKSTLGKEQTDHYLLVPKCLPKLTVEELYSNSMKPTYPVLAQRYFRRPSLKSLYDYLYIGSPRHSSLSQYSSEAEIIVDWKYCHDLLKINPEIDINMVKQALSELRKAFDSWEQPREEMQKKNLGGYIFMGGANFIVFGLTKDRKKLKVGLVDV